MITISSRFTLFPGKTARGGQYHDFSLLNEEFKKEKVFEEHHVRVNLAYVGFFKYYKTKRHLPYKKPGKITTRPDPKLTDIQKQSNKQKSQGRIVAGQAIAGTKRYKILGERFRSKSEEFADAVTEVCAGLFI